MKITTAETLILEALWAAEGPMAVEEIRAALPDEAWTDGTVRTLMSRLAKKKAVSAAKDGRRLLYRPLIARDDYVHHQSKTLLDRLFDGRLEPFVAHFSEREDLSEEDIARLKQLIERLGRGK